MIHRRPGRVLLVVLAVAAVFCALSYPGRNDRSGAWMCISGMSWIAFLLSLVVLVVLGSYVLAARRRAARSAAEAGADDR